MAKTTKYFTDEENQKLSDDEKNLQIVLALEHSRTKKDVCDLLNVIREQEKIKVEGIIDQLKRDLDSAIELQSVLKKKHEKGKKKIFESLEYNLLLDKNILGVSIQEKIIKDRFKEVRKQFCGGK